MPTSTKSAATTFLMAVVLVTGFALAGRVLGASIDKLNQQDVYIIKTIDQDQQGITAKADQARADAAKPWQDKWNAKEAKKKAAYDRITSRGFTYNPVTDKLTPLDDPKEVLHFNPTFPPKPKAKEAAKQSFSVQKLCKAIALHETGGCTAKVGSALVNNCHGIKGKKGFARYKTKAQSYSECERIWTSYYQRFPDLKLAKKWSGNDRAGSWLANVTHFYETL